jgi:hypothetical protein
MCTPERAFSALKLLKSFLYIHVEVDLNVDQVIDRFLDKPVQRKLFMKTANQL